MHKYWHICNVLCREVHKYSILERQFAYHCTILLVESKLYYVWMCHALEMRTNGCRQVWHSSWEV